jgi:DNA polymerase III subunit gamma/tau
MPYQALALKYRPRNFDTLVGQEYTVLALKHALEKQRFHHAYLFTGARGIGKTTLSRVVAKSLNCIGLEHNSRYATANPCGKCSVCISIDAGCFIDYIEMDAASNRGVEEMAQLLKQAIYAPSNARFKIYMIDEVHMLTNHAFNSMLKILEEPPSHVKFILATTDPKKIPVTVLSRCLQFNLKQISAQDISTYLKKVLDQEGIEFENPALNLLAQAAQGSMRDALSLTDQAIGYGAGKIVLGAVRNMLGMLDRAYLFHILNVLGERNGFLLLKIADEISSRGLSYNAALRDLSSILHWVTIAQSVPKALNEDLPEREEIMLIASMFSIEEVQIFYQIVVHGRDELSLAPDESAGFSMTLLRMLAFRPESDHDSNGILPLIQDKSTSLPNPETVNTKQLDEKKNEFPLKPTLIHKDLGNIRENSLDITLQHSDDNSSKGSKNCISETSLIAHWNGDWLSLIPKLAVRGAASQLAQQSEFIRFEVSKNQAYFYLRIPCSTLIFAGSVGKLQAALSEHFTYQIVIETEIGPVSNTSVNENLAAQKKRQHMAELVVQKDLFVKSMIHEFGSKIVPKSVVLLEK